MFRQIAILGPGLLGASIMQAAKSRGLAGRLTAWSRREETREWCAGQPWCDAVFAAPEECVRGADLVVACVPVDRIGPVLAQVRPAMDADAVVTDVGSTKATVCRAAAAALSEEIFVGAHPMAGSEKSGAAHASPELFAGRVCFVTPTARSAEPVVARVEKFWEALGMRVVRETPEAHDRIVAQVSHLPHALAAALSALLAAQPGDCGRFAGQGLRDTTRVAGGDPELWRAIFQENRPAVLAALAAYQQVLQRLYAALAAEDMAAVTALLEDGRLWRRKLDLLEAPQE